jgi:hypothetical protein
VCAGSGLGHRFLLLYRCLPGATGWAKGLSFGGLAWFFRVVMYAASQWIMFNIPVETALYTVAAGLGELLLLGLLYGLALRPTPRAAAGEAGPEA